MAKLQWNFTNFNSLWLNNTFGIILITKKTHDLDSVLYILYALLFLYHLKHAVLLMDTIVLILDI